MESLFIADDEFSIREGLKYIIDWEALGFQLCGEASNGEDALTRILALQPSLVLLDVKMPKMHGTEVIRRAREAGFEGKCIILSGYSDFKYAQEAIKSGVNFYLTKPIDEDELLEAVSEIRTLLEEEKQHSSNLTQLKQKAKHVILQELLTDTLDAPLSQEDIANLHLKADAYQVVICEDFNTESKAAPYTFAELLRVTNKDNNTFDHIEIHTHDVVLLKGTYGLKKLTDFLEHFEEQTPQAGSPLGSMFLTIGRPVSSLAEIPSSFQDASALLRRRFFCAQEQHYLYEIIRYLSEQFEMIMNATGNPSRDTILDDVLFYIDHNYRNNIKLETIAPLFGYNNAYLGKIFNKTVGESFNSYVDHKRIEHSKELLKQNKWKVYEIAEQVATRT